MKILVIDNYDSFTYNLVHMVKELGFNNIDVFRNDKISIKDVDSYDKIILSPGPGIPSEAGILLDLIKIYASTKSILGICLGEQAIGEAFGAKLLNLPDVHHGIDSSINVTNDDILFNGIGKTFKAGRYHSWIVSHIDFPEVLKITAMDDENQIMAIAHRSFDVRGIQFHPESILTPQGINIMRNWLMSS